MASRSPPNKGVILYPATFHMRITEAMKQAIIGRGGAAWIRALVEANMAAPITAVRSPDQHQLVLPSVGKKRKNRVKVRPVGGPHRERGSNTPPRGANKR